MKSRLTRRNFLKTGFLLAAAVLFKGTINFLTGSTQGDITRQDFFEKEKLFSGANIILDRQGLVWLVKDEKGFYALDRRCSHLGCLVQWDEEQKRFICPCHHSKYGPDGRVLAGPASHPMVPVKLRADRKGNLIADTTTVVSKEQRFNFN